MPIISLGIFLFIAFFFMAMVQIHLFEIAFSKLGLTPETTLLLLISTLIGSGINLRLFATQQIRVKCWVAKKRQPNLVSLQSKGENCYIV